MKTISSLIQNRVLKNYLWALFGQNFAAVFSMISLALTLRIITTYDYGTLVVIQTYCYLISGLFCFRSFNGLIKFTTDAETNNDYEQSKRIINSSFLLDIFIGILGVIMSFLLILPVRNWMEWNDEMMKYVYIYIPVILFLPFLNGAPVGILRKLGYFKHVNILHTVIYGLQTFILLVIWLSGCKSPIYIYLIYVMTEIFESIVLIYMSYYVLSKRPEYNGFLQSGFYRGKNFLTYNIYFSLISSVDQILGNVSTIIINKYLGNNTTAALKVITKLCNIISKIATPLGQVIYPEICLWISNRNFTKVFNICFKYTSLVIFGGSIISIVFYFLYDYWIWIFDSEMLYAKNQSLLYLIYTILAISLICIHQTAFALDIMKQNLYLISITNILYIIFLIPAIKIYGIYGFLCLQILQLLIIAVFKTYLIKMTINRLCKNDYEKTNNNI